MKNLLYLVFFCTLTFYVFGETSPVVKVLLERNVDGAFIDIQGKYKIYNPENGKVLRSGSSPKKAYVQASDRGVKWEEEFSGVYQIKIVPNDPEDTFLVNGTQYQGTLAIYNIHTQLQLVNEIPVEKLLMSLLPKKLLYTEYKPATYDAIAIVERTNIYATIYKNTNPYWDFNKEDIGYEGLVAKKLHPTAYQGAYATKYLVLTYNHIPFSTSWTENSAGSTASYSSVFRKKTDGPAGVLVPIAQKHREQHRWRCSLSQKELSFVCNLPSIKEIELFQEKEAGKTYALRLSDGSKFKEYTFFEFQKLLGDNRILSTDMSVFVKKDQIIFEGYGKGSGVGLCIHAAEELASYGDDSLQILSHFYPSADISKFDQFPINLDNPEEEHAASQSF